MNRSFLVMVAMTAAVALLGVRPPDGWARAPGQGPELQPAPGVGWRETLERAVAAAEQVTYEALMVVVSLDERGPGVTEVRVRRGANGDLAVESSEAWLIARASDSSTMFRDHEAGRLLTFGQVQSLPFALAEVDRTYDVAVAGRAELPTGTALAVALRRGPTLRERLFVDDETGLVVRRETYDRTGHPVRMAALTQLMVADVSMQQMDDEGDPALGTVRRQLGPSEVLAMDGHGWSVPTTIGDQFELRAGFSIDDDAAVHLVYSDGLYTLSVLEQPGHLDAGALDGAQQETRDGIPVYRWPGAEPARMVWTGGGRTFTAVTDAPADVLMEAVADLPHDQAPSLPERVRRGLVRLAGWRWPFS